MALDINVPDLGEGLDSGDVLSVLVAEGDLVSVEQGIVELETDKAVAEIPTPHAGRVTAIHVEVGQSVAVGNRLITVDPVAAEGPTDEPAVATPPPEPSTTVAPESEDAREQTAARAKPQSPSVAPPPASAAAPREEVAPIAAPRLRNAPAGPAVRRYARELGVDLASIHGSGDAGRIVKEDVRDAVRKATGSANRSAAQDTTPATPSASVTTPGNQDEDAWGPITRERLTKIRATIAANMVRAKSTAPHVTNFDDADVTELEQIRQSNKDDYAAAGIKLTTMPFLIKAVAQALRKHPTINASLDLDAREILYKQYVTVGIAVDTDRGLMVPVLRDADTLGIPQIARALADLAEKARTGKIAIEDMRGGTFTISNLGAIGGTYSTPVINVPEVAILLLGRSRPMPVVIDGQIQARLMMPLSLSYDHRLVDGAAAARFLNEIKSYLQSPARLLLAL